MRIDGWTLALQAINVLILVWLLGRFLFRPVMDAIAARQAAADTLLADARKAKDEAAAETVALKAHSAAFATEAAGRMTDMQASVVAERARLMAKAKQDADALADQARAAANVESRRTKAELERQASLLAIDIAAKLLGRVRPTESDMRMLHALLDRIATLSEEERGKLASDPALSVVTPDVLGEAMRSEIMHDLALALPGIGTPVFTVDPALIAGFELQGSHMRVRNSWRADLEDVSARLLENDHAG